MEYSSGELMSNVLLAAALSVVGAWLLARRFRAAMRKLMSQPVSTSTATSATPAALPSPSAPGTVTAVDNRRDGWRVTMLLIVLSALIALSSAALQLALMRENLLTPARTLTLAFVFFWPVIPVLAQLWRWSRPRMLGVLLLWCLIALAVIVWRQIDPDPGQAAIFLASEVGPTILLVALLCMGNATRAIAPVLLLPLFVLLSVTSVGIRLLDAFITRHASHLAAFVPLDNSPLGIVMQILIALLFLAAPCVLAWWPLKWLARKVAAAYTRGWLSELMILFTAVWGIALLARTLGWMSTLGAGAFVMLSPLLWIPVVMLTMRQRRRPADRPPTLLVLRVFQRDRMVRALFDSIIERWRCSGNTVLIAGTDLLERTLDADDILNFLDGRLGERFIADAGHIPARMAAFDFEPDAEGRYRINECYCHDATWRAALTTLLSRSDVVLMDLRSFQRHNEGCAFELGELARAPGVSRAVVLTDPQTDMAAAQAAAASAPAGRFHWLEVGEMNRAHRRDVLQALFVANDKVPAVSAAPSGI